MGGRTYTEQIYNGIVCERISNGENRNVHWIYVRPTHCNKNGNWANRRYTEFVQMNFSIVATLSFFVRVHDGSGGGGLR